MNIKLGTAILLLICVAPACMTSTAESDDEEAASTDDYLSKGDPLPAFPSFTPVRIVRSSTGDCVGTGSYLSGFLYADVAKCSLDASRHYAIVPTADGHHTLRNFSSGSCLDVLRAGTADRTSVIEWPCNGGDHQKWRATELAAGRFRLQAVHSGKCLEVDRSNDVRVSTCRVGDSSQTFSFREAATTQIVVDGRATGGEAKCFDVPGASSEDGVRIQQWDCWGPSNNQQFYPLRIASWDSGAIYELRAAHSGKCVSALDGDDRNGTAIVQSTCVGGAHQRFYAKKTTYGFELHPRHVDKCVDRGDQDPVTSRNGAVFQLWACGGDRPNETFETTNVPL